MAYIDRAPVVNHVITPEGSPGVKYIFATRNEGKLREYQRILGEPVVGFNLGVDEIQAAPEKVLERKAQVARQAFNGRPIFVEDTALKLPIFNNTLDAYADQLTSVPANRALLAEMAHAKGQTQATFRVGIAYDDGKQVHTWAQEWSGHIADKPRGTNGFGFDDIFIPDGQVAVDGTAIPDGQGKTYAEMTDEEKDRYSPRRLALEVLRDSHTDLQPQVFGLQEPSHYQTEALDVERLTANPVALQHAYNLEMLADHEPRPDLSVGERKAYHEEQISGGELTRYVTDPESASLGLLILDMDKRTSVTGKSLRLATDDSGNLTFWQKGDEAMRMAIAARTLEFQEHHNEETYAQIRAMMQSIREGVPAVARRSNVKSPVVEKLLEFARALPKGMDEEDAWQAIEDHGQELVYGTAAINELGYARQSSDRLLSRTGAAHSGLFLDATGIPSSLYALGGMPPVTGWKDVLVTSALSYMRSYIPRNSIYAGNVDLQIRLFEEAKSDIQALGLPGDIEEICLAQIGVSIGCEDPEGIVRDVARMKEAGVKAVRIYTTNPDKRTVDTAQAIHDAFGDDITICVGPIVDVEQARKLVQAGVKILYAGHGGGENCTSLAGGGAANSLELAYKMSLDPDFNEVAIGLEGGTGSAIGGLLGMVDVISLNRRGVAGGVELGGLFVQHSNGEVVQPYHGSASPQTQWIEGIVNPTIRARRVDAAGRLRNVEGGPGFAAAERHINSIVDRWHEARMLAGRALADQDSRSIGELRQHIAEEGYAQHRIITGNAQAIAGRHPNGNK